MTHATSSPIRAFRQTRQLTLKQFGELFPEPYDKTTISRWETQGVPSDVKTILEIERVTGIPRTQLMPEMFDFSTMPVGVVR